MLEISGIFKFDLISCSVGNGPQPQAGRATPTPSLELSLSDPNPPHHTPTHTGGLKFQHENGRNIGVTLFLCLI